MTFTRHEEDGAFTLEMTLRNLPPVQPFVVKWGWPLFRRAEDLDPARLRQNGGRPRIHTPDELLEILGNQRLKSGDWQKKASEAGIRRGTFYNLRDQLEEEQKVQESVVDGKWERIIPNSKNSNSEKEQ